MNETEILYFMSLGALVTFILFGFLWIDVGSNIRQTDNGKFYIQTHFKKYQLVSDEPITLKTILEDK